ncbi:MAG: Gfo/Idh/MocA family protein [Rhabdaerophilum sp.]
MRRFGIAIFLALGCGWSTGLSAQNAPPPVNEIDLKLFDKAEVDRSKGCTFALWQANRDPEADRFAFIFTEQFRGTAHQRDAAQIKVGTTIIPLQRVGAGGKPEGYGVHPFQLYKMPDEQGYVVLDLKLEPEQGEAVEISSGKLMVTMLGKLAFRASVKGSAGCYGAPLPGPAAAAPAPVAAAPQRPAQPAAPNAGGGVIPDITVHDADVARFLLGEDPVSVVAQMTSSGLGNGVEDSAMSIWSMPSGAMVMSHESFTHPFAGSGLEVHGTDGSIFARDVMTQNPIGSIELVTASGREVIGFDHYDLYAEGVRRFQAAVAGDGEPAATGFDGVKSLAVALAVRDAAARGVRVDVNYGGLR